MPHLKIEQEWAKLNWGGNYPFLRVFTPVRGLILILGENVTSKVLSPIQAE